jgi:hypothetical protein
MPEYLECASCGASSKDITIYSGVTLSPREDAVVPAPLDFPMGVDLDLCVDCVDEANKDPMVSLAMGASDDGGPEEGEEKPPWEQPPDQAGAPLSCGRCGKKSGSGWVHFQLYYEEFEPGLLEKASASIYPAHLVGPGNLVVHTRMPQEDAGYPMCSGCSAALVASMMEFFGEGMYTQPEAKTAACMTLLTDAVQSLVDQGFSTEDVGKAIESLKVDRGE